MRLHREDTALRPIVPTLAAALAASGIAAAEPDLPEADAPGTTTTPVFVTATRTPESLPSLIRPVELIEQDTIERSGQDTLVELLQQQANVQAVTAGGPGQPSNVFLRGANSAHTLVLLDGIRINSAAGGTAPFANLPPSQFARMELVPGPMSSLYGSEALGGVIQLFSNRWPEAPGVTATAGYGSYNTGQVFGGVSAGSDTTGFTLNAGYTGSDAFSATKSTAPAFIFNPDDDGYRNTSGSASLTHRFAPDHEIGLTGFYSQGRTHFDSGTASDDLNDETIGVYSAYSRNRLTSWWQSLVRVGASDDALAFQGSFAGDIESHQTQATWQNDFATSVGTIIAGLEWLNQSVGGDVAFSVDQRNIYSAFAGYTGSIGRHTLHASLRNDDNSQFGSQTTGALGYAFQVSPQWRVRASAGTAFQAPTFFDLYDPFLGNASLQPEESSSWEAGVDLRTGTQRVGLTYFDNHITNLVVYDSATMVLANLNEARIQGLELSYDGQVLGLDLRARLTVQDPVNDLTGALLPRRAKVFGNAGIARSFGRLRLGAEVAGAGPRYDSVDEAPASRMDGYVLVNVVAGYALAPGWSVDLRWNNVLDTDYELAQNYYTPGSNVFVSVRYTLR
jgi:vitamin B12 transporter